MTSDQSSFSESFYRTLDVAAGTDWSNDTAIQARAAAHVFEQGDQQRRVTHPHTSITGQVYASAHEALITLPDISATESCHDARVVLHARRQRDRTRFMATRHHPMATVCRRRVLAPIVGVVAVFAIARPAFSNSGT